MAREASAAARRTCSTSGSALMASTPTTHTLLAHITSSGGATLTPMTPRARTIRLLIGGAAACLAACGSSSPVPGASSSAAGSGAQASAPPACSVITQTEASTLVGSSVTSQDAGHVCIWTSATGGGLNVQVYAPGTNPQTTVQGGHACGFGSPSPVNVGDAAVYCSTPSATGSSVVFAKHGLLVQIQCSPGSSSTGPCDKNGFIATAQAAAGRL